MKNKILILFLIYLLIGCNNYNSEEYISNENSAIKDIIPQLTDFENMVDRNKLNTNNKLKLFLISSLNAYASEIHEPNGYVTSVNGIKVEKLEIKKRKKEYEEEYEKYKREKKLFRKLRKGKINKRILTTNFKYSNLKIELIPENKNRKLKLRENEFGYLFISRIVFNRTFNKGYLSYSFFCGSGCAWYSNIEIEKVKGKWIISETFSGGIA